MRIAYIPVFNCKLWTFQKLELASNKIRSMDGLQGHKYLEVIDLEDNEVNVYFVYVIIQRENYKSRHKHILVGLRCQLFCFVRESRKFAAVHGRFELTGASVHTLLAGLLQRCSGRNS